MLSRLQGRGPNNFRQYLRAQYYDSSEPEYTGTSIVILPKRWLWLPDDGLCKPKHVGVAFMTLVVLIV
jgi:hypothetical protein